MQALQSWTNHYQDLFDNDAIRAGNYPEIMYHGKPKQNAIVLVHGLTDSPYFMKAIAKRFYAMGFNVLLPLLPGHGLKIPDSQIDTVTFSQWLDEVNFAIDCATGLGEQISIGGLSAGANLATYKAITDSQHINGALFLFAGALDIHDPIENVLRFDGFLKVASYIQVNRNRDVIDLLKDAFNKEDAIKKEHKKVKVPPNLQRQSKDIWAIGDNPYRYVEMTLNGAGQLADLIKQTEDLYKDKAKYSDIIQPVFAAHSEADIAAGIAEIELLIKNHPCTGEKTEFFRIEKNLNVSHPSIVLEKDIEADNKVLEKSNPVFNEMMDCVEAFVNKHLK
ncbi:alpha/beta hydrolase [Synechocystis sp. PCC 7509]|uniref:alpha/beta hydrolase n=1 Tax=Synechocystis sp. PCC 7509 TaxID=927677 RepID=UPI0002ACA40F|nr:alpha/beta hydrolase [Synechocystis sp. PCC 7509]